jgi:hypothetical protein
MGGEPKKRVILITHFPYQLKHLIAMAIATVLAPLRDAAN